MDAPEGWKLVPFNRFVVEHSPSTPNYPYKVVDTFGGEIVDGYVVEAQARSDADTMNKNWQRNLANAPAP